MGSKWMELDVKVERWDAEGAKAVLAGLVRPLVDEFKRLVPGERSLHYLWEGKP